MITESRIKAIEDRLDELQQGFLKTQKNQVPITAKTDNNAVQIDALDKSVSDFEKIVFPEWSANKVEYFTADRVSYYGKYYRCIQQHTSQADWTPDTAASLWVEMSDPGEEFPEWKQPTGAHDAYAKGDKVSHNAKHWTSDIDANVYEPGVYGWSEV